MPTYYYTLLSNILIYDTHVMPRRIRGLSDRFIYFNDDVFLGSRALPEDFVQVSGVQKFHLAWDLPKCAPGDLFSPRYHYPLPPSSTRLSIIQLAYCG